MLEVLLLLVPNLQTGNAMLEVLLLLVPSLQTGNAMLEVLPLFYQKRQSLYTAFLVRDKERVMINYCCFKD
jgi:hypothetical protein